MSGGSKSQTQVQSAEPWKAAQPYLRDIFSRAQQQFNQGGPQYYPGQTYVPFSDTTQNALSMMEGRAGGSPYEAMFGDYVASMFGQPGVNLDPAIGGAHSLIGGLGFGQGTLGAYARNPFEASVFGMVPGAPGGVPGFGEAQGANPGVPGPLPAAAVNQLTDTASGAYLGRNPFLDDVFNTAANKATDAFNRGVMPGINATFGGAGRTGSGIHGEVVSQAAGELGDDLSSLAASIYAPAYESERGRQLGAASTLGGLGLDHALNTARLGQDAYFGNMGLLDRGLDRSMNAATTLGSLGATGVGQLGDLYGMRSDETARAAGMVPTLSALDWGNLDRLLGVGGAYEDLAGRQLQSDMDRWNFEQNAPYAALDRYASLLSGTSAGYGTTTTTSTQPRGSGLTGLLGGVMSGLGATSSLLGTAGAGGKAALGLTGPLGWGILGGSALMGLL